MPDLDSQIFSVAVVVFLLIGAAKLTIEQLINLVIQFKRLRATIEARYSLEIKDLEKPLPIDVNPDIMSGTPVFKGTRVPVDALIDNLAAGVSLDEFLENFPSVSRDQALAVLNSSRKIRNSRRQFSAESKKQAALSR